MRKIFLYTIKCLKQTFRNAERVIVIFIVPVLFIVGMAFLYGEESSFVIVGDTGNIYNIGVINHDQVINLDSEEKSQIENYINELNLLGSPIEKGFGLSFIENMNYSGRLLRGDDKRRFNVILYTNIETAGKAVQSRFITLCFIIPNSFSKTMLAGLNHRLNVSTHNIILNDSDFYHSESTIELIGDLSFARFSEATILLEEMMNSFSEFYWVSGLTTTQKIITSFESITTLYFNEFEIFSPALLVFVLISSTTGIASIVGFEREQGTIDRLKISKFPIKAFLGGLTLTQVTTTLLTMVIVLISIFLLGFPAQSEFQVIYVLIISTFAVIPLIGISLGIAAISDGQMSTYLPSLIAIPMAFLTGNFIPLPRIAILGEIQLWHLNPFFSVGNALRKIMIFNLTPSQFYVDLIMLIIIGMIVFSVGMIVFLKRVYR